MLASESDPSKFFGPVRSRKSSGLSSPFTTRPVSPSLQKLSRTRESKLSRPGGTLAALEKSGVSPIPLEKVGHFPEMLDGRVKTLQPEIFAGILARKSRPDHMTQIASLGIHPFDMVVCNFYAFEAAAEKPGATDEELIEMIDIGGPSLVRASAEELRVSVHRSHSGLLRRNFQGTRSYKGIRFLRSAEKTCIESLRVSYPRTTLRSTTPSQSEWILKPDFRIRFTFLRKLSRCQSTGKIPIKKAMIYAINGAKGGHSRVDAARTAIRGLTTINWTLRPLSKFWKGLKLLPPPRR